MGVRIAIALVALVCLAGCSTTGTVSTQAAGTKPTSQPARTATQKAIGSCIATVAFGGIAGAILGAATGRNAGETAALGAAVGAGACAALLYVADKEDQQRIAQLEREAILANASQTQSFVSKKNAYVVVTTAVEEAPLPALKPGKATAAPSYTACRYASQKIDVAGQSAAGSRQLWCRIETGDWLPVDDKAKS